MCWAAGSEGEHGGGREGSEGCEEGRTTAGGAAHADKNTGISGFEHSHPVELNGKTRCLNNNQIAKT